MGAAAGAVVVLSEGVGGGAVDVFCLAEEVGEVRLELVGDWRDTRGSSTEGARLRAAVSGSEASPMCWLVSWLVAHVMPAVEMMPSAAASDHRMAWRLMATP